MTLRILYSLRFRPSTDKVDNFIRPSFPVERLSNPLYTLSTYDTSVFLSIFSCPFVKAFRFGGTLRDGRLYRVSDHRCPSSTIDFSLARCGGVYRARNKRKTCPFISTLLLSILKWLDSAYIQHRLWSISFLKYWYFWLYLFDSTVYYTLSF